MLLIRQQRLLWGFRFFFFFLPAFWVLQAEYLTTCDMLAYFSQFSFSKPEVFFKTRSCCLPVPYVLLDVYLLPHTCFRFSSSSALQRPDNYTFIWIRCGGAGKLAGQEATRPGLKNTSLRQRFVKESGNPLEMRSCRSSCSACRHVVVVLTHDYSVIITK